MSSQPTTPKPTSTPSSPQQPTTPPQPSTSTAATTTAAATSVIDQPLPPPTTTSNNDSISSPTLAKRTRQTSGVYSVHEPSPKFGATKYNGNLFAVDRTTMLDVRIQSKFDRGFFIADNDWTCYRRNYFQVSATFNVQGFPMYYQNQEEMGYLVRGENDQLYPVNGFMMGISARVADEDKLISLVQHSPKRDKGPQNIPEPKPVRANGDLSVMSTTTDQSIVTFERIQFKSATANNGKRRAAQQYYVLLVELFARLESGHLIKVASNRSAPLVVRGRSPGHYAERNGKGANDDPQRPQQPSSASSVASPPSTSATVSNMLPSANVTTDYYYNHHQPPPPPPPVQQHNYSSSNGSHMPMMPSHVETSPVVMRGTHDRSISAPGAVDVYQHDMNQRYGYYHRHDNNNNTASWMHTRMASSGESYPQQHHMYPSSWYYHNSGRQHHHPPPPQQPTTPTDHGMGSGGSPGVVHSYHGMPPPPPTSSSYRPMPPSSSFTTIEYHSDPATTSYAREEIKLEGGIGGNAATSDIRATHVPGHHDNKPPPSSREVIEPCAQE
ncbi:p53-like transcription factor [Lichtheimia hyalospora FSU 10163]|nr:p53-like transcription factor [Lichtheimia hyalospora FSU 10163]